MMIAALDDIKDSYEVIVVGAGGAGLSAAIFASLAGKSVLLVERAKYIGGMTALSAGTVWAPNTPHSKSVGAQDSFEKASSFLTGVVGNHTEKKLREQFLKSASEAIALLESRTDVALRAYPTHPDYEQETEGAVLRGRALEPLPFDGRKLGDDLRHVRPPLPEFTLFGGMMVDRKDISHLLNMTRSWNSFRHASTLFARYAIDRLNGPRGTRLVMGNALVGRLALSLKKLNGSIVLETSVDRFLVGDGRIGGLMLSNGKSRRNVLARDAVVLASGGFNRHPRLRHQLLHPSTPEFSLVTQEHDGAMHDLALEVGAQIGQRNFDNAFWAPVSMRKRRDGSTALFPHFILDRSKPRTVCVDQSGRRFVNESTSYHRFARAMFEANERIPTIPCYIVTDAVGLKKYGLGMVRPGALNLRPFLNDGYLVQGCSLTELAAKLAIEPEKLEATISRMNLFAYDGVDPEFGRGETEYHRINGDPSAPGANPTLGPIEKAPFYAVRLYPCDIGAAAGLVVDEWARVLDGNLSPVAGLYACGNTANSVMGGTYPGPGITLGPAITLAYLAVKHACSQPIKD
jgi:succinate dehydrogenase/fumarate reductase flavoprotein subunit